MRSVGWQWLCVAVLSAIGAVSANGAEWYVSPTGSSGGNGSAGNPWDIVTAFNQPASVHAGDTIWLRGGTYTGIYNCKLHGAAGSPIIVRQYAGERAIVRGSPNNAQTSAIYISGSYVWLWGFEVTCAGVNRVSAQTGSWPNDIDFAGGINTGNNPGEGANCKLIELVVHDTCEALNLWVNAAPFETNNCILYHNGWDAPDRGHGHGVYTQNNTGIKLFKNNIVFAGFSYGTQAYGSGTAYVNNFTFDANTYFNCGVDSTGGGANLLLGGGRPSENIIATHNTIYRASGGDVDGDTLTVGYSWVDGNNVNCTVTDNYLGGQLRMNHYLSATVRNNTMVANAGVAQLDITHLTAQPAYDWDANSYYCLESAWQPFAYFTTSGNHGWFWSDWKTGTGLDANSTYVKSFPAAAAIFVRPSDYEPGARATITIFNWPQTDNVSVDVSSILAVGDTYSVIDAQNYFGVPIATGTYSGGTISIPMTSTSAAQPSANAPKAYVHTSKQFGCFVLQRTGAASGPPNIPAGVAATDGAYFDKVSVTWNPAGGAASYKVFRNTTSNSASATQIGSPNTASFDDTTAVLGTTYYYWVKANNAFGDSGFSGSDSGFRLAVPAAPGGLAASDGSYVGKVALTWTAATNATSYLVYRNTTNASGSATQIGTPTATSLDDTAAVTGTTYYYWVKGVNSYGNSGFSASDSGYVMVPPAAPGGISASDGTYSDRIRVTWIASSSASSYKVFRNAVNDSGSATQIGTSTTNSYNDASITSSSVFFYWVSASNLAGDSGLSVSDSGYRSTLVSFVLYLEAESGTLAGAMTKTSDATASNGQYISTTTANTGTAQYTINAPSNGDYVVWGRVLCPDGSSDSYTVWVDSGSTDIYDMAEGIWSSAWQWTVVNGRGGGAAGSISPRKFTLTAGQHTFTFQGREVGSKLDRLCFTNDLAYVPLDDPVSLVAPTGLSATNGTYWDRVAVTWNASSGATSYKVFRNSANNSGTAVQIGTPSGTSFDDTTAVYGTTYYYWAKATDDTGDSGFSNSDSGYEAGNRPPTAFDDNVSTIVMTDLVIDVLTNDSDPDGDTLVVASITTPDHGGTTLNPDYSVTYSPDSGYIGADSFDYTISDGNGATDTATVYINVTPTDYTLTVTSSPIIDVAVSGLIAGMTNYLAHITPGDSVTLTAPLMVVHPDKVYYFVRWTVGGVAQTDGQASATFDVNADTTATAVYKSVSQIKISGPKRVYEKTRARYKCVCVYTEGPSEVYTVLAMWRENSPVLKFVGPGVLKFGSVSRNIIRKFTATYGGVTGSFRVTIKNR